jgi:glycine C-acetyltransferase/8-amino-7-oxononanoate synthase
MESAPGARTIINGKEVDYFGGCSYYGFHGHPDIVTAACEAVKKYGISSATSPIGYGNNPVLAEVERSARRFFNSQAVLYYASGCSGGTVLVQGLREEYDIVFIDRESHYSVMDAAVLSGKPVIQFEHMSVEDFEQKLHRHLKPGQRPMLMSDGIFPITGEIAPAGGYWRILKHIEGALLCLDDAHAFGVIGKKGRGTFEHLGLEGERRYAAGTLSKGLGGYGGIIPGKETLIKKLKERSHIPNACTPPPTPAAAAAAKALDILHRDPGLRERLWDNTIYAKQRLKELDFCLNDTPVPIICLHTNGSKPAIDYEALQKELFKKDIAVSYVPGGGYTGVPPGGAIRISIFSTHTREQIQRLVTVIGDSLRGVAF